MLRRRRSHLSCTTYPPSLAPCPSKAASFYLAAAPKDSRTSLMKASSSPHPPHPHSPSPQFQSPILLPGRRAKRRSHQLREGLLLSMLQAPVHCSYTTLPIPSMASVLASVPTSSPDFCPELCPPLAISPSAPRPHRSPSALRQKMVEAVL